MWDGYSCIMTQLDVDWWLKARDAAPDDGITIGQGTKKENMQYIADRISQFLQPDQPFPPLNPQGPVCTSSTGCYGNLVYFEDYDINDDGFLTQIDINMWNAMGAFSVGESIQIMINTNNYPPHEFEAPIMFTTGTDLLTMIGILQTSDEN